MGVVVYCVNFIVILTELVFSTPFLYKFLIFSVRKEEKGRLKKMDKFLEVVADVNSYINDIVWGLPMIILILGTGILLTIRTKVFQVTKFKYSFKTTLIPTLKSIGKKKNEDKKVNSISQFEAFSAAISGTIGTGNILGVASAIITGGPGAVFWMWVSAFFGMITNYAENVLGLYYRKREKNGDLSGGAMYYISEGMGKKWNWLAYLAAIFCVFAAIGMSGTQTNKISGTIQSSFNMNGNTIVALVVGIIVAIVLALIIIGGIKRIGKVTSFLVPIMSVIFIVGSLVIIVINVNKLGSAFGAIFGNIFSFHAAVGGFGGYMFAQIIQKGLARGVFSNEAGLGSSVIAHSASETREPVKQGLWGVVEVFIDTFIICTVTALVILTTYSNEQLYGLNAITDAQASLGAFSVAFGDVGTVIFCIIIPLFAFTTILAWSYYGEKAVGFMFRNASDRIRTTAVLIFKIAYVLLVIVSAVIDGELAWGISDTCNGLMAIPNLIAVVCLSGKVVKITKNYFDRKKGEKVEPMLSAYPELNEMFKNDIEGDNNEMQ